MANPPRTQLSEEFLKEVAFFFPPEFITRSPEELKTYGKDWTKVFAPDPSAIVFPKTTEDVSKFMKLCARYKVAVVPSGGRTGLAGGAVAPNGEVVLSLSKMNLIGKVDPLAQTVRVQAGAVTEAVHQNCAQHGLTWPVDFASKGSSHVGGNISTNAGGVKVIHYGLTREWVLGLQVVTMQGDVLELNGALEKNNTGLDLRQLFIGTEGTLGIVTEATLKLCRLPGTLDVFFFAVKDIPAVLTLFLEARKAPFQIMAFECLTHNCLEAVTAMRKVPSPFKNPSGAYVLLEVERPTSADAAEILENWLTRLFEEGYVADGVLAQSPRESRDLWTLREGVSESLFHKGFLHKNDISVPISELETFIAEMYRVFEKVHPDLEVYLFGHIGDGNLHINTLMNQPMEREVFLQLCEKTDEALFALVQKHQGSVSAEHGIGLLKKSALRFSRTPRELELLKSVKKVFDPDGLLNPGKIFD